jgi:hypothetical protein
MLGVGVAKVSLQMPGVFPALKTAVIVRVNRRGGFQLRKMGAVRAGF